MCSHPFILKGPDANLCVRIARIFHFPQHINFQVHTAFKEIEANSEAFTAKILW